MSRLICLKILFFKYVLSKFNVHAKIIEGFQEIRSTPPPRPRFKYPMKMK